MLRIAALVALVLLAAVAPVAPAADPESGTVSRSSPKVTWTGQVTSFQSWQLYNQGQHRCLQPSCDTFTLEVAEAGGNLALTVASQDSPSYVEVVKPDGSSQLFGSAETVKGTIKNAPSGSYTIHVAQNESTQATHQGTAELSFPSATPPAPAAPGGEPPPQAEPPATTLKVLTSKARRGRKLSIALQTSAPLSDVRATLLRGSRTVAAGRLGSLRDRGKIAVKAARALKRGRYVLRVTAKDEHGRDVGASRRISLR